MDLKRGTEILLATHNAGKQREMRALLQHLPLEIVNLNDLGITDAVAETGKTFEENALIKARHYAKLSERWTIAEDSGLEINALNGEPGVYSARYGGVGLSGGQRCDLVLQKMRNIPHQKRTARFKTVAVLCSPAAQIKSKQEGCLEGFISSRPMGANGFGYDPIFWVAEFEQTTAMLSPVTKNKISHRGAAMRAIADALETLLGD